MKVPRFRITPSLVISAVALFVAFGGSGYAAAMALTASNAKHLGGKPPSYYLGARHFTASHGVHFITAGHTVMLGRVGHFTFTSTCSKDSMGQNQVTFDVTADTTADLDGNGPMPAGTKINIHTDSDALDSTTDHPLMPGDFAQVGSASSSTEIAQDGEEVDIFYTDGVNWKAPGSSSHDCFAGYTGFASGFPS
jgi:hypothetical protein